MIQSRQSERLLWPAVSPNIAARASNLPVRTQTLVLATSGWSGISSLYANPGGMGRMSANDANFHASAFDT